LKVWRSRPYKAPGFEHLIDAARGAVYIKASYPKYSPVLYIFKKVFVPLIVLEQSYSPDPTYIKSQSFISFFDYLFSRFFILY